MGCPVLTERDYYRLHNCTKKTAYSGFFHTVSDDTIGNRKTYDTTESGSNVQSVYSANNLNQYTNITNPSQSPTYDDDGNMVTMTLASGSWSNTWDGENRLIETEKSDARLDFLYDFAGRRVEKKIYSGSTENWTLATQLKFVYDGYKLIEELDGQNADAIVRKYVWNSEEPYSMTDTDGTFYFVLDANKNVTEIIDSTGAIRAHYEYSPFGKITKMTGDKADDNPIRFSSEYYDTETGLVYYNFRYLSPELGRWLSKDPIEEHGGWNLYGMLANSPIDLWDYLGQGDFSLKQNLPNAQYQALNNLGKNLAKTSPKPSTPPGTPYPKNTATKKDIIEAYNPWPGSSVYEDKKKEIMKKMPYDKYLWYITIVLTWGEIESSDLSDPSSSSCPGIGDSCSEGDEDSYCYFKVGAEFDRGWDKTKIAERRTIRGSVNNTPTYTGGGKGINEFEGLKRAKKSTVRRDRDVYQKYRVSRLQCKCNPLTGKYWWQFAGSTTTTRNIRKEWQIGTWDQKGDVRYGDFEDADTGR